MGFHRLGTRFGEVYYGQASVTYDHMSAFIREVPARIGTAPYDALVHNTYIVYWIAVISGYSVDSAHMYLLWWLLEFTCQQ